MGDERGRKLLVVPFLANGTIIDKIEHMGRFIQLVAFFMAIAPYLPGEVFYSF